MNCYCEGTKRKLREWLQARYGSLQALGKAWGRYSFETWEDVNPPDQSGRICGGTGLAGVPHRRCVSTIEVARRFVSQARSASSDLRAWRGGNAGVAAFVGAQRVAVGGDDGCVGADVGGVAARKCAVAAVPGDGSGAGGRAGQAVLARGGGGRAAVDAAAGDWPAARRWTPAGCGGCAHLEPDLVRERRARNSVSALEAAAGWAAVRGVWARLRWMAR